MIPVAEGYYTEGYKTANAGTAIVAMIPGMKNRYTHISRIVYTTAGTPHTITMMKRVADTTLSAAAAAAQAVIVLTADPGSIAANDLLAIQKPNGSWHFGTVQSASGLNVTLTANVPTGGFSSGAKVIFYGVAADSDHSHHTILTTASAAREPLPDDTDAVIMSSSGTDEPLIVSIDNITNAGKLHSIEAFYSRVPGARDVTPV